MNYSMKLTAITPAIYFCQKQISQALPKKILLCKFQNLLYKNYHTSPNSAVEKES